MVRLLVTATAALSLVIWLIIMSLMTCYADTAGQGTRKKWVNIDAVMRGDLFRAADVAYRDFVVRFPGMNKDDYDVSAGYGSAGIMVIFRLRFSETRTAVFDSNFIK